MSSQDGETHSKSEHPGRPRMNRKMRFMNLSLCSSFLVPIPLFYYSLNLAYEMMPFG